MGEATRGALGAVMVVATTLTRSARSDIFHCVNFLGWHRHKKEWLDPWRKLYIDQKTDAWYTTLSPVSGGCGLSMVVLPIDDATRPSVSMSAMRSGGCVRPAFLTTASPSTSGQRSAAAPGR